MKLLLDEHLPPTLARQLRADGLDVEALSDWLRGHLRTAADSQILVAARADQRVLVTFDLRTIPSLLREWAATGEHHAGIILVDDKAILSDDIGTLRRSIRAEVAESGHLDWQNRVIFLRRR